jgi:hypothetical protein
MAFSTNDEVIGTLPAKAEPFNANDEYVGELPAKQESTKPLIANPVSATKQFGKDVNQIVENTYSGFRENAAEAEKSSPAMYVPNLAGAAGKSLFQAGAAPFQAAYAAAKDYAPGATEAATNYLKGQVAYIGENAPGAQVMQQAGAKLHQGVEAAKGWLEKHPTTKKLAEDVAYTIAAPGGVRLAKEAVGGAADVVKGAAGTIAGAAKGAVDVLKPAINSEAVDKAIKEGVSKGIKPTVVGKPSQAKMTGFYDKAKDAINTIADNRDNIKIVDEEGEAVHHPRSALEMAQAIDQAKKVIYNKYHDMALKAGDQGATVNVQPIVDNLKKIVGNEEKGIAPNLKLSPKVRDYAGSMIDEIKELQGQSPEIVEERIKELNSTLQNFYMNPDRVAKAKAQVDASIAQQLRDNLDEQITSAQGPGYDVLKKQYGALKGIEKEVNKRALVNARRSKKSVFDLTDIFTGGEILTGLATMNPAMVLKGATGLGIKELWKKINNPDRYIEKMFNRAYRMREEGRYAERSGGEVAQAGGEEGLNRGPQESVHLRDDAGKVGVEAEPGKEVAFPPKVEPGALSDEEAAQVLRRVRAPGVPGVTGSEVPSDISQEVRDRLDFRNRAVQGAQEEGRSVYADEQPVMAHGDLGEALAQKHGVSFEGAVPGDRNKTGVLLNFKDDVTGKPFQVPAKSAEADLPKAVDAVRQEDPEAYGKAVAEQAGAEEMDKNAPTEKITTPQQETPQSQPILRGRELNDADRIVNMYIKTGRTETGPSQIVHKKMLDVINQVYAEDIATAAGVTPEEAAKAVEDIKGLRKSPEAEKVRQALAPSLFYGEPVEEVVQGIKQGGEPRSSSGEVMFQRQRTPQQEEALQRIQTRVMKDLERSEEERTLEPWELAEKRANDFRSELTKNGLYYNERGELSYANPKTDPEAAKDNWLRWERDLAESIDPSKASPSPFAQSQTAERAEVAYQRQEPTLLEGTPKDEAKGKDIAGQLKNVEFKGVQTGLKVNDEVKHQPLFVFQVLDNQGRQHTSIALPLDATAGQVAKRRMEALRGDVRFQIQWEEPEMKGVKEEPKKEEPKKEDKGPKAKFENLPDWKTPEGQPMFQKGGQGEVPKEQGRNIPTKGNEVSDVGADNVSSVLALKKAIEKQLPKELPEGSIEAVGTPKTEAHQMTDRLVSEVFGKKAVWFKMSDEVKRRFDIGGAVMPGRADEIFINESTKKPVIVTGIHEGLHVMQREHPDLYNDIKKAMLEEGTGDFADYQKKMIDKGYSEKEALDESIAEISGERFTDHDFLQRLANKSPEAFRKFVQLTRESIAKIRDWVKKGDIEHAGKYFRDLDKVDSALQNAVIEMRKRGVKVQRVEKVGRISDNPSYTSNTISAEKGSNDFRLNPTPLQRAAIKWLDDHRNMRAKDVYGRYADIKGEALQLDRDEIPTRGDTHYHFGLESFDELERNKHFEKGTDFRLLEERAREIAPQRLRLVDVTGKRAIGFDAVSPEDMLSKLKKSYDILEKERSDKIGGFDVFREFDQKELSRWKEIISQNVKKIDDAKIREMVENYAKTESPGKYIKALKIIKDQVADEEGKAKIGETIDEIQKQYNKFNAAEKAEKEWMREPVYEIHTLSYGEKNYWISLGGINNAGYSPKGIRLSGKIIDPEEAYNLAEGSNMHYRETMGMVDQLTEGLEEESEIDKLIGGVNKKGIAEDQNKLLREEGFYDLNEGNEESPNFSRHEKTPEERAEMQRKGGTKPASGETIAAKSETPAAPDETIPPKSETKKRNTYTIKRKRKAE